MNAPQSSLPLPHRLVLYARLVRLDKPIGILLLLWPTLWGLWFAAQGVPAWHIVLIFILGTVLMRSAGCAINDYADRDFDKHVARTQGRVLTSGQITPHEALLVALVLTLASAALLFGLNRLSFYWAIGAAVVAGTYPYFKRFFAIPQAYLGIAFGFGIPMGFAAIQNQVPELTWWLMAASLCWTIAYDTQYAMVDRVDDLKIGIKTSAITFGRFDVAAVGACYAATLFLLGAVGVMQHMGIAYHAGLAIALVIALVHLRWIRQREPAQCFKAFLHNNWFGAAVFGGIALDFALR